MKYLEITILSLFIGFLIIFYLSNSVYNKCISEKTQESFVMDAQERESLLAEQRVRDAQKLAADSKISQVAQQKQQAILTKLAMQRSSQRAGNKLVTAKWDNTRNSQFGKYNSYVNNISQGTNALNNNVNQTAILYKQKYMIPNNNSQFDNSIPVQLNKLKVQFGQLYTDSKAQDDKLASVARRITSVNNLLSR